MNDGILVLRILAEHPSTATFVSTKLLRWLLRYDPQPALVREVADAFTRTSGNIPSMIERDPDVRQRPLGAGRCSSGLSPTSSRRFA